MQAEVLVEIKAKNLDNVFTYNIPAELFDLVKIGVRVIVPFGRQTIEGFVMKIGNIKTDYKLRDIISVKDKKLYIFI